MKVQFPTGDSADRFLGDPVVLLGSSDAGGNYPTVGIASGGSGNPILGIVVAFEVDPTNLELKYRVASTARYAYIVVDPMVVFQVMVNGTLTVGDVGANAVLSAAATGSTVTGFSGWSLYYTTTPAANAAYQLNILGVSNIPNNPIGQYCVVDVLINTNTQRAVYSNSAWAGSLGV